MCLRILRCATMPPKLTREPILMELAKLTQTPILMGLAKMTRTPILLGLAKLTRHPKFGRVSKLWWSSDMSRNKEPPSIIESVQWNLCLGSWTEVRAFRSWFIDLLCFMFANKIHLRPIRCFWCNRMHTLSGDIILQNCISTMVSRAYTLWCWSGMWSLDLWLSDAAWLLTGECPRLLLDCPHLDLNIPLTMSVILAVTVLVTQAWTKSATFSACLPYWC